MTEYEILDLRATYGERATSFAKFWLSLTFAVFGAGYYLRQEPDVFAQVALVLFYGITTFICAQSTTMMGRFIKDISDKHRLGSSTPDEASSDENALNQRSSRRLIAALIVAMYSTFVALLYYVLLY
ncbi:MAG: hypothetical protein EP340_07080 [Alphaproteobacteria bacterium]|nr:MAG: hypothetical protein EP340_07080 [Alphaproteobacteria bacterium]